MNPQRSSETYERCVIVGAYFPGGATPEQGYRVRDLLNELDTDGWWFLNPGAFVVAFRCSNAGAERARACYSALGRLPSAIASLSDLRVGAAEGEVLCNLASAGHLDTPPLGDVVNEAFRQAARNAS